MENRRKKKRDYPKAAIFLNGTYPKAHLDFYRNAIQAANADRLVIAVDGAIHLFDILKMRPHVVLGDFDSVKPRVLARFADCERVEYSRDKDATDGELAVRYVIDRECRDIFIYGGIDTNFETDQMLANIFLLDLIEQHGAHLRPPAMGRLLDHRQSITMWSEGTMRFCGRPGDPFSIVPLSSRLRISIKGARWNLDNEATRRGRSWTLRNEMASNEVEVFIRGTALLIHRHG